MSELLRDRPKLRTAVEGCVSSLSLENLVFALFQCFPNDTNLSDQGHGTLHSIYASVEESCRVKGWNGVDVLIIGGDFQVRLKCKAPVHLGLSLC